jgi:hypothetical protein
LNNHCHLWGMVAGKTFVGLDFFWGQHFCVGHRAGSEA